MSVHMKCEMLDFDVRKRDLFYARKACFSAKMRILDISIVNCDTIFEIRVKISSEPFGGRYI